MRQPTTTQLILRRRLPGESRLAQANRLGIAEATLRRAERDNRPPRNQTIARAFMAALNGGAK